MRLTLSILALTATALLVVYVPRAAFGLACIATAVVWYDRGTWRDKEADARAQAKASAVSAGTWARLYGELQKEHRSRRRSTDFPQWWLKEASDKRGMNWTAGQQAEAN